MIKLIVFLFSGCWHKWKVIKEEHVCYKTEISSGEATRYVMQCEHCGNIKAKLAK